LLGVLAFVVVVRVAFVVVALVVAHGVGILGEDPYLGLVVDLACHRLGDHLGMVHVSRDLVELVVPFARQVVVE